MPPSFEDFAAGVEKRGFRRFDVGGPHLIVDTTRIADVDWARTLHWVRAQL